MNLETVALTKPEPRLLIHEDVCREIGVKKQGQKLKLNVKFKVIEKTKSFTIIRVEGVHINSSKRIY